VADQLALNSYVEKSCMPTMKPLSATPGNLAGVNAATIIRTACRWVTGMNPSACYWAARAGLYTAFTYSGVKKLFDFQSAIAEQAHAGLPHPALFAATTIATRLTGSALVLLTRRCPAAGGAALLAGCGGGRRVADRLRRRRALLGHQLWHETGTRRFADLNSFLGHFGLIGGFAMIEIGPITKRSVQRSHYRQ
jgi:hypothetical protein